MRKVKLYFDSSSISALEQVTEPERMFDMHTLWKMIRQGVYDVVLSDILTKELLSIKDTEKKDKLFYYLTEIKADHVKLTDEMQKIAELIIQHGILTENSVSDSRHVGCALVTRCDIIVSYNFRHMVNTRVIHGVRRVSVIEGYGDIDIMSPDTLLKKGEKS